MMSIDERLKWFSKMGAFLVLLMVAGGPVSAQETTISGLFFGDYYAVLSHNDPDIEGANGFWARRMYLTFDSRLDSEWDSRVRFEAATAGDFETSRTMEPFLKDLWVRWRRGNQRIVIGLSSSPTWNLLESQWGYRAVEKTPLNLFKMGSSRDFGVAFQGSFDEARKVRYHVMVGNGSSTKTETNKGKKVMGALQLFPTSNLIFEAYADFEDRPEGRDRSTYTATAIATGDQGRVGFLAARQSRRTPGEPDVDVDVYSVFGVLDASEKINLLARWDRMNSPIPDGGGISYFRMNSTSKGNFFLAGVDIAVNDQVHFVPNIKVVTYDTDGIDSDIYLKTTFFITF